MIVKKEIKIGKKHGKTAAAQRSILDNGSIGTWFHIAVSQARKEIKTGADINGVLVVEL